MPMKRSKRITAILLGLMTLILLLPARVLGLGALNTEQEASLSKNPLFCHGKIGGSSLKWSNNCREI